MDIYRARFVQYPTPGINALAFSHATKSDFFSSKVEGGGKSCLRLAVGRSNGDIEIWNPLDGRWWQEAVFRGGKGRSIEGLVWTQDPPDEDDEGRRVAGALRLFSIGYSNAVTEWNLATGLPLREWSGTHSEVWCIAAQTRHHIEERAVKRSESSTAWLGQNLVAGCADGSLVILNTADNDLQYQKFLARPTTKSARVLSLDFQTRSNVIAGFADSTVKIYDIRKGQLIRSITLGAGPKGGPKNILVWSVKATVTGDIVTGDSTGEIRFFDRKQLSQIHRIAGHDADVLDIAVSKTKGAVFSAGMDRRTIRYLKGSTDHGKWTKIDQRTMHEHDVKALAAHEGDRLDVIASGGIDTNLVISPLRNHGDQYQYTISGLPQLPQVCSSTSARLVATWWEREVSIWFISRGTNPSKKKHILKARIAVQGDENITSVCMSADGTRVAVGSTADVKEFSLHRNEDQNGPYVVKKLGDLNIKGAKLLRTSPNGRWLAVATAFGEVSIFELLEGSEPSTSPRMLRRTPQKKHDKTLGDYTSQIARLEFSPNSKMLVASDLTGYVESWNLQTPPDVIMTNGSANIRAEQDSSDDSDDETTATESWKRNTAQQPRLDSPAIILHFRPESESKQYHLVVVTAKHRIRELDMSTGYFTEWSKRNPNAVMPEAFKRIKDRAMGVINGADGWIWLYGSTWLFGLDITTDHDEQEQQAQSSHDEAPSRKKRKRENTGAGDAVKKTDKSGLVIRRESVIEANGVILTEEEPDESDSDVEVFAEGVRSGRTLQENGKKSKAKWYVTHKYRPILGIVPVQEGANDQLPEVVLIERPIWTLDLPSRYENSYS